MSTEEHKFGKDLNSPTTTKDLNDTSFEENTCDNSPDEEIISDNQGLVPEDANSSLEKHEVYKESVEKESPGEIVTETNNQVTVEETTENDTSEKTNSSKSRELKSILALSKEAKLDTNLPAKRKESTRKRDFAKLHSFGLSGKSPSKSSQENKTFKFPVTAEAELEEESFSKPHTGIECPKAVKRSRTSSRDSLTSGPAEDGAKKNRKIGLGDVHILKPNKDMFCWRCHKDNVNIACETCPRSYHWKCLRQTVKNDKEHWPCPECVSILKAESTHTRSEAMKGMTLEHLCSLLKYALNRMIQCQGSEPFLQPVNDEDFPTYKKFIIQPMDLTKIEKNIKNNLYGSTQAFEADAKWILHNCIIFNSYQSKLTYTAKNIVRVCKQEMAEIELCPNCYLNANSKKNSWFVEVCPKPHILVWAKLKGFPYWPAKAMCINSAGMVDVRFFGAHDRAWVHYKECYLYCEKDPNTFKQKRYDIEKCIEEVDVYIENLRKVYDEFRYAPYKTFLDPENELKQLQTFLPKYKNQKPYSKMLREKLQESLGDQNCLPIEDSEETTSKLVDTSSNETEFEIKTDDIKKSDVDNVEGTDKKDGSNFEENDLKIHDESFFLDDSPKLEKEKSEEGYGTDDTTDDDIDLERRKAFVGPDHNSVLSEEIMEDEEDADTQVPNNISVDSLIRGKVRMRGGLNVTPGKIKILPRRKSEVTDTLKRNSSEFSEGSLQKLPRRNSDQSTRSDSSRISSISDKINRIETFEKMEVTLGTDDVARVSISEDISCDSSSKSGSEHSVEIKRKPVQVDINNAEFTISPSNKRKISETLIKRLSDPSCPEESSKVEKVKKTLVDSSPTSSISPSKSQTDMLIEKFKGVVQHKIVDFAESSEQEVDSNEEDVQIKDVQSTKKSEENNATSTMEEKTGDTPNKEKVAVKKKRKEEIGKEVANLVSHSSETNKNIQEINPTSEKQISLIQPSITDFIKVSNKSENTLQLRITEGRDEDSESDGSEKISNPLEIDKNQILTIIHSSLTEETEQQKEKNVIEMKDCNKKTEVENTKSTPKENEEDTDEIEIVKKKDEIKQPETDNRLDKNKDTLPADKNNKDEEVSNTGIEKLKTSKSTSNEKMTNTERTTKLIKINITDMKPLSHKSPKHDMIKPRVSDPSIKKRIEGSKERNTDTNIIPVKASINQSGTLNKEFRSYSNIKNKKATPPSNEEVKLNIGEVIQKQKNQEVQKDLSPVTLKKRKMSADETSSGPSTKLVKLVPIESILNKGVAYINKIDQASTQSLNTSSTDLNKNSSEEMLTESIKSEPESDDDFQEPENLEAKKRYLSALNISEKVGSTKTKENEIRTRSRAEEKRERFKIVDNLTRVIDDVALNYSANHEGENQSPSTDKKKNSTPWQEGEITVKSFAKIQNTSQQNQQRARKSFPTPSLTKTNTKQPNVIPSTAKNDGIFIAISSPNISKETSVTPTSISNSNTETVTYNHINTSSTVQISTTTCLSTSIRNVPNISTTTMLASNSNTLTTGLNQTVTVSSLPSCSLHTKPHEPITSGTMPHVILFNTPTMNYGSPIVNPVMGMVSSSLAPQIPLISAVTPTSQTIAQQSQQMQAKANKPYVPPNVSASQNYIPQSEGLINRASSTPANNIILNNLLNQVGVSVAPTTNNTTSTMCSLEQQQMVIPGIAQNTSTPSIPLQLRERPTDEDLTLLHSIVPENVTRAVNELMMRPPPRLKPRPPGMLSNVFDDGIPSSAGEITAKINSVAHRLNDYLRGMLIETLEDLGRSANPEAKIINLQLEIEALKYRHSIEMQEIKKNMGTLLKDIQKSIEENRERIISEARSVWEAETIKRVELAKSKQWCANCSKEAKFYCCWNTSYCDYPCQQKHWPQHMGKCTQNIEKSTGAGPVSTSQNASGQSVILRQTSSGTPKSGTASRIVSKPTKVYMNNKTATGPAKTYKALSTIGNHITVIEKTPGNYELLGNGSLMGGKVYPAGTNLLNSRFKTANIMSVTPATSSNSATNQIGSSTSSSEQKSSIESNSQIVLEDDDGRQ